MSTAMFGGDPAQPFDPAALNAEIDRIMGGHRERVGAGVDPTPAPVPGAVDPASGAVVDGGGPPAPAPAAPPVPAVEPFVAPPPSPFGGLSAEDQAELLVLHRALNDPERAMAVRQAALGVPAAPLAAVPAPPPDPTLPEHVDPESFEADLWRQNQAAQAQLEALRSQIANQGQQSAMERARTAAQAATAGLVAKYGHVLAASEIEAVCQTAASRGYVDAMIRARGGEDAPGASEAGMTDALEFVIRSNDGLLAKVLGGPTVALPPATPQMYPGPPAGSIPPPLVPQPQHTAEALERQRNLTALATGASPTGMPVVRQPLEVDRGSGGRLTESARSQLISEVMSSGLRDQIEGG